MTITRIKLDRFTAFEKLDVKLSPGINIFIGENGTGKTHLLKVAYTACDISKTKDSFAEKLIRTFLPYQRHIGRLVHRTGKSTQAVMEIYRGDMKIRSSFSNHAKDARIATIRGKDAWTKQPIEAAYIPVKEMLANAPGFLSQYESRELHFEEVYRDILLRAYKPKLLGPHDKTRKKLLTIIQRAVQGKVQLKDETFFLRNKHGNLEFTLLAEGMRKLALLWLLIQNGTLLEGAVLFWDEPEANLNPKKMGTLVEILLELQRLGVQIVLATHNYVLLKEFDLQMKAKDNVRFHALYRDLENKIQHQSTDEFLAIHPNAIADTFLELYDRDIARDLQS